MSASLLQAIQNPQVYLLLHSLCASQAALLHLSVGVATKFTTRVALVKATA